MYTHAHTRTHNDDADAATESPRKLSTAYVSAGVSLVSCNVVRAARHDRYLTEILQSMPVLRFVMRKPRFDANRNPLSALMWPQQ